MSPLEKEDYEEPLCPLVDPATGESAQNVPEQIPLQRIIDKLEEYCGKEDYAGAERHLSYWLAEAREIHDKRGEFSVQNERMGYYRKQGRKDEAIECANAALALMEELGYENAPSGGTCYVNCGTVYDAFAMPEEALVYFEKARAIYEAAPYRDYGKLGGLYNNMALALCDLTRFDEAAGYYEKAIEAMGCVECGAPEQAISYLNLADLVAARDGADASGEEIDGYLAKAKALLDDPKIPRNGYYAFVLEKCAPTFYTYGDAAYGDEISARSKELYEKNRSDV